MGRTYGCRCHAPCLSESRVRNHRYLSPEATGEPKFSGLKRLMTLDKVLMMAIVYNGLIDIDALWTFLETLAPIDVVGLQLFL